MTEVRTSTSKQDKWRAHLEGWKASGLSMRGYCQREGIGVNGLRYWRARLSESKTGHEVVKVAVKLSPSEPMIEVVVGNRFTIRLPREFRPEELGAIIKVIESLG